MSRNVGARRCALEDASCIIRYKRHYQDLIPAIHKELMARLARHEADEGPARSG